MWGIRTLDIELFGPICENLLHDGKNFYHVGNSNPRGGAFWQKRGGGAFAGQSQPAPKVPGAGYRYEVPRAGAGAGQSQPAPKVPGAGCRYEVPGAGAGAS